MFRRPWQLSLAGIHRHREGWPATKVFVDSRRGRLPSREAVILVILFLAYYPGDFFDGYVYRCPCLWLTVNIVSVQNVISHAFRDKSQIVLYPVASKMFRREEKSSSAGC